MNIIVKEVMKINGNQLELDDPSKLIITLVYEGNEYRVTMPDDDVSTRSKFEKVLRAAVIKVQQSQSQQRTTENLTAELGGEYGISNI